MYHHDLEEDYLTLFVSETLNSESGVDWYHCSLSLVDAFSVENDTLQPESNRAVLRQIHIENNGNGLFTYVELRAVANLYFRDTHFFPLISEPDSDLDEKWKILCDEFEVYEKAMVRFGKNLRFNPEAPNCRTAVRDTLRKVDLELYPEYTKSEAGLYAPRLLPYR